jgi:hypothetical protein
MKIAFAIVNEIYLPYAFATRESFLRHNLDYNFCIFVHGKIVDSSILSDNIISVENYIGKRKYNSLNSTYSIFERSCALKTIIAAEIAIKNEYFTKIVYLDSDLFFVNQLSESVEEDFTSSIFLTPHTFSPVIGVSYINDLFILSSGVFNAGFFEINNTDESKRILEFLNEYMYDYCTLRRGAYPTVFVDQMFLDLIPAYFENYRIIKHEGYNMSFHNLHERGLRKNSDIWQSENASSLIFFHFSGIDFEHSERCSKYYDFNFYEQFPDLKILVLEYYEMLVKYNVVFSKSPTGVKKILNKLKFK